MTRRLHPVVDALYGAKIRARDESPRKANLALLKATKAAGCPCGERRLPALDLHHRDPREKRFAFSFQEIATWPHDGFVAEVAKCDVICANCHRCLHASA